MTTIAEIPRSPFTLASAPLPRSLYRLSLEKYEAMVKSGLFTKRDRIELVEGILVAKMTQHPPHAAVCEMIRDALNGKLPSGWHVRGEKPLRIPTRESLPGPDLVDALGVSPNYM
jgi:hypothetical protein